jgi:hypothetical protein
MLKLMILAFILCSIYVIIFGLLKASSKQTPKMFFSEKEQEDETNPDKES